MADFLEGPPLHQIPQDYEKNLATELKAKLDHIRQQAIAGSAPQPFPLTDAQWAILEARLTQAQGQTDRNFVAAAYQAFQKLNIPLPDVSTPSGPVSLKDVTPQLKPQLETILLFPTKTSEQARLVELLQKSLGVLDPADREQIFAQVAHYSRYQYAVEKVIPDIVERLEAALNRANQRLTSASESATKLDASKTTRQEVVNELGAPPEDLYFLQTDIEYYHTQARQKALIAGNLRHEAEKVRKKLHEFVRPAFPPANLPQVAGSSLADTIEIPDDIAKIVALTYSTLSPQDINRVETIMKQYQKFSPTVLRAQLDTLLSSVDPFRRGHIYRYRTQEDTSQKTADAKGWGPIRSWLHHSFFGLEKMNDPWINLWFVKISQRRWRRDIQRETALRLAQTALLNRRDEQNHLFETEFQHLLLVQKLKDSKSAFITKFGLALTQPTHKTLTENFLDLLYQTPTVDKSGKITSRTLDSSDHIFLNHLDKRHQSLGVNIVYHRTPAGIIDFNNINFDKSTVTVKPGDLRRRQIRAHEGKPITAAVLDWLSPPAVTADREGKTSTHPHSHTTTINVITERQEFLAALAYKREIATNLIDNWDATFNKFLWNKLTSNEHLEPPQRKALKDKKETEVDTATTPQDKIIKALELLDLYISLRLENDKSLAPKKIYEQLLGLID